jgi:GTP-binding protein EngB required for normal cell division
VIKRNNYLSIINFLQETAIKYSVGKNILNKSEKCTSEINEFSLKVLFVGGFSAGKSALINAILNRDLLIEDQKPETTIASEILYDNTEFVELLDNEGIKTTCSLEDVASFDTEKYNHLVYHIDNEYIKKHLDYTIVDMPGFNSGIERHNKAIMQYVAQGNAYILVIDCEEGEMKSSVKDFIKEIKQYDNNLAIVISKSDKKPEKDVESIRQKIADTASSVFNQNLTVISASKYDNDLNNQIDTVLNYFDTQDLFNQKFGPQIIEIANLCYAAIESVLKTSCFDDSEIENEIRKRLKAKEKLQEQLVIERRKLSVKMKNQVKPLIINDLQNSLQMNSALLAASIISGGDNFSRSVNNILRPILISATQRYTEDSFYEFIEQMDLSEIFAEDNSDKLAEGISKKYLVTSSKLNEIISNADKTRGTYRTVMGALAIITSVVAPWIELILVFLPDILKVFGVLNQSNQRDNIKHKVENEIIPQIVSKLSLEIDKSLKTLGNEMMEEVENKINSLIDIETEALNVALNMKTSKQSEYDLLIKDIWGDLDGVQAIICNEGLEGKS